MIILFSDDFFDHYDNGYDDAIYDDDEWCRHECDEYCYSESGFAVCDHQHCFGCGGCGCPGYCNDYQSYNLPPDPLDVPAPQLHEG